MDAPGDVEFLESGLDCACDCDAGCGDEVVAAGCEEMRCVCVGSGRGEYVPCPMPWVVVSGVVWEREGRGGIRTFRASI